MKKIKTVGSSLANFAQKYLLKVRVITDTSDARFSIRDLDFSDLHMASRIRFRNPQAQLRVKSDGSLTWITLSPPDPYSWIAVQFQPTPDGPLTLLRLKKSIKQGSQKVVGTVKYSRVQSLPDLMGRYRWKNDGLSLAYRVVLGANPVFGPTRVEGDVKWESGLLKIRAAMNGTPTGRSWGAQIALDKTVLAVMWQSSNLRFAGDFTVGRYWNIAFQTSAARLIAPRIAVKWHPANQSISGAVDIGTGMIATKFKRITGSDDIAVILSSQNFGRGPWKLSLSFCTVVEKPRTQFPAPSPFVPFRN
jgi:hypothetical protein